MIDVEGGGFQTPRAGGSGRETRGGGTNRKRKYEPDQVQGRAAGGGRGRGVGAPQRGTDPRGVRGAKGARLVWE